MNGEPLPYFMRVCKKILYEKLLYGAIFFGAFGIGSLGEKIAPGHGRDVMYCFSSYSTTQFMGFQLSPVSSAAISFSVQSIGEVCQYYGVFHGTFDWKDFISYTVGSALVFGTEKTIMYVRSNKRRELSDLVTTTK